MLGDLPFEFDALVASGAFPVEVQAKARTPSCTGPVSTAGQFSHTHQQNP